MKEQSKKILTYRRRNRKANPASEAIKEALVSYREISINEEKIEGGKTTPLGNAKEPIICQVMAMEEERALEKIDISGAIMASILQRVTSSPGNIEGLLFGQITQITPTNFSDDNPLYSTTPNINSPTTTATITSFISSSTCNLNRNISKENKKNINSSVIGWFSGRRRSPLRPSFRESSVTPSLNVSSKIRIFLLFTSPTPSQDINNDVIHTHEYKAYQYIHSKFVPKTLNLVNIGPAFRPHYASFSPISPFPSLPCESRGLSSMAEDFDDNGKEQVQDNVGMGFDVAGLGRLMGPEASSYTGQLEDMYKGMLATLDQLATVAEKSSSRVFEEETDNMKLRFKVAGLE